MVKFSNLLEVFDQAPYPLTFEEKYSGMDLIWYFEDGGHEYKVHFEKQAMLGKKVFRVMLGQRTPGLKAYKKVIVKFKDPFKVIATIIEATTQFLDKASGKAYGLAFALPVDSFGTYKTLVGKVIQRKFLNKLDVTDIAFQPTKAVEEGLSYTYTTVRPHTIKQTYDGKWFDTVDLNNSKTIAAPVATKSTPTQTNPVAVKPAAPVPTPVQKKGECPELYEDIINSKNVDEAKSVLRRYSVSRDNLSIDNLRNYLFGKDGKKREYHDGWNGIAKFLLDNSRVSEVVTFKIWAYKNFLGKDFSLENLKKLSTYNFAPYDISKIGDYWEARHFTDNDVMPAVLKAFLAGKDKVVDYKSGIEANTWAKDLFKQYQQACPWFIRDSNIRMYRQMLFSGTNLNKTTWKESLKLAFCCGVGANDYPIPVQSLTALVGLLGVPYKTTYNRESRVEVTDQGLKNADPWLADFFKGFAKDAAAQKLIPLDLIVVGDSSVSLEMLKDALTTGDSQGIVKNVAALIKGGYTFDQFDSDIGDIGSSGDSMAIWSIDRWLDSSSRQDTYNIIDSQVRAARVEKIESTLKAWALKKFEQYLKSSGQEAIKAVASNIYNIRAYEFTQLKSTITEILTREFETGAPRIQELDKFQFGYGSDMDFSNFIDYDAIAAAISKGFGNARGQIMLDWICSDKGMNFLFRTASYAWNGAVDFPSGAFNDQAQKQICSFLLNNNLKDKGMTWLKHGGFTSDNIDDLLFGLKKAGSSISASEAFNIPGVTDNTKMKFICASIDLDPTKMKDVSPKNKAAFLRQFILKSGNSSTLHMGDSDRKVLSEVNRVLDAVTDKVGMPEPEPVEDKISIVYLKGQIVAGNGSKVAALYETSPNTKQIIDNELARYSWSAEHMGSLIKDINPSTQVGLKMLDGVFNKPKMSSESNDEYERRLNYAADNYADMMDGDDKAAEQAYNALGDQFKKLVAKKKIERSYLTDVYDEIFGDKVPIKPFEKLSPTRMREILAYNSITLPGTRIVKAFPYAELKKRTTAAAQIDIPELKVTQVEHTQEQLDRMTVEYDHFNKRKHGNLGVKIIKAFNVSIPTQEEGYKKFMDEHPGTKVIAPAFHGTGSIGASMILRQGFAVLKSGDGMVVGRMLGDGIYFSNVLDKVAQYVSDGGYSRGIGNEGYIFEMDAALGQPRKNYRCAGTGDPADERNVVSPEWCVFEPNSQLKIKKAYMIRIVSSNEIDKLKSTSESNTMKIKGFDSFLKEAKNKGSKGATTYIFMDGQIPVSKTEKIEFEDFDPSKYKGVRLDTSGVGPMIIIDSNTTETFAVKSTREFMSERDKLDKFLRLLGKAKR